MSNDSKINNLTKKSADPTKRARSTVNTEKVVDANGKVLTTVERRRSTKVTEPDFSKFYHASFDAVFDIQAQVLACLAYEAAYDTNTVILSSRLRRKIATRCGFKQIKSLTNAMAKLRHAGQLKKISSNEYMVSPYIFAKGTWERVSAAREAFDEIVDDAESRYIAHHQPGQYLLTGENRKADDEAREDAKLQRVINRRLADEAMLEALSDIENDEAEDDDEIPFD